jgi:hypothetical protein
MYSVTWWNFLIWKLLWCNFLMCKGVWCNLASYGWADRFLVISEMKISGRLDIIEHFSIWVVVIGGLFYGAQPKIIRLQWNSFQWRV